jgi:nitrous oxidase accessory protein NosD
MQTHGFIANVITVAVAGLALTVTLKAQNTTSFVSTAGIDTNNCTVAAPCRSFSRALAVTNAEGEIMVLTSGNYAPALIAQPVTITAIGVDVSIDAITNGLYINTTGNVTITGLNLHGSGTGSAGIWVRAVGFLRLYNMNIENFAGPGINFVSNNRLAIYDSKITDSVDGLAILGSPDVYLHNCIFDNNQNAGVLAAGAANITIADSSAVNNRTAFAVDGGTMSLYNDRIVSNNTGIASGGSAGPSKVYFADCLIFGNTTAYSVATGSELTGSSPGTSLIAPMQSKIGTLSPATPLQ